MSLPQRILLPREEWRQALDCVADAYDRFRPGYPAELPMDVAVLARLPVGGRILEVGCGTGQLTTSFACEGYSIVALEPGPALAGLARANLAANPNVRVEVTTLESWAPDVPPFDLVLAAQSFHLVDPDRRFTLASGLLSDRGALAVVWNFRLPGESAAHLALQAAYARHAPGLSPDQLWQDTPFEDEFDRSGLFASVFMRKYLWTRVYSAAEYVGLLESHATHFVLPAATRSALLQAVGEGITRAGGHIAIDYVTRLYVAARRPP